MTGITDTISEGANNEARIQIADGETESGTLVGVTPDHRLKTINLPDDILLDAFGKMRVTNSKIIWAFIPTSGKHNDDLWNESLTGGATSTFESNKTAIKLSTGTANGDKAIRATNRYFMYVPNRSQFIAMSFNFEDSQTNVRKRIGQFDELDGFFLELNSSTLRVGLRSSTTGSAVNTLIDQSSWNIDKLDGTGTSGVTLDLTKQQIFIVDYQWLGSGRIRYGFFFNGVVTYCHEILNSNTLDTVYSNTPNLPFRSEIENLAAIGAGADLRVSCFSVSLEGDVLSSGKSLSITSGVTEKTIGGTEMPIFSVRLKSTFNRLSLRPLQLRFIMTSGTKAVLVKTYLNASLTAASWVDKGDISQFDESATAFSGGTIIDEEYLNVGGSTAIDAEKDLRSELHLGRDISGVSDIYTVTTQTISGTAKVLHAIALKEFI